MNPDDDDMLQIVVESDRAAYGRDDELAYVQLRALPRVGGRPAAEAKVPVEIVMVLDVSGSMHAPLKYPLVRRALDVLASALADGDRLACVLFAHATDVLCSLRAASEVRHEAATLVARMDASPVMFGGHTFMAPGLVAALDELELRGRPDAVRRVYCLTDGELHDAAACAPLLDRLRSVGAETHLYGFGSGFDVEQLAGLVSGCATGSVKPLVDTTQVVDTFRHLAGTAADVAARDLVLDVAVAPDVLAGDAFQHRPVERVVGAVRDGRISVPLGSVERSRTYATMLEVRLPAAPNADTTRVGIVTARWRQGRDGCPGVARVPIDIRRADVAEAENRPIALVRDLLLGLRERDPETQKRTCRAKLELYRAERRDPALLAAIERKLWALEHPEEAEGVAAADELYLQSTPSTMVH